MPKPDNLITQEGYSINLFLTALVLASASGFISYFMPNNAIWIQWIYLLHVFTGILMSIPLLRYVGRHFKRTQGIKRPLMTITGVFSLAVIIYISITGFHITLFGQSESKRWIYETHILAAMTGLAILIFHVILHKLTFPEKRLKNTATSFSTITSATFKNIFNGIVICSVILFILTFAYKQLPSPYQDVAAITPYQLSYGDNPFSPSQTKSFTGGFLDPRRLANSDRCGTCHAAITEEWKSSMHAQAASDKSYQTNINLLAEKMGMPATRYCEGCHAPIALLSGELTAGGKLDTYGHMVEGIGCMGCHGIDQVIHLKGVASYNAAPKNDYLFADSDNWLATKLHNYLIRIQPRSHRIDMNRPIILQAEFCATCHTQFMDKDINNWGWVKMQDEYSAWLNSPYSGQSTHEFSDQQITRCQDCHFPLEDIDDPSADKNGLTRSHRSLGANTAIPFYTGDKEQLRLTTEFLQADKVRINIEKPNRSDATHSHKYVSPEISLTQESPAYYYLNEKVSLNVIVTNANVGHDFPGGSTDINEVWIHLKVVDAQNNVIYESGALTENNDVDPSAQFYLSIPIDRQGQHVWKHDLFNTVGDSYKKIIKAGDSDIVFYGFTIPSWAKGPITISSTVRYRKFNNRYARWALEDDTIKLPIVDMARDAITIPIRKKYEVETNVSTSERLDENS